ncbi:MAG: hypothetical protein L0H70_05985 [Xanthomonadales bacterium]|nr:hypothetical protein [Xanthomonadales bacterium]
MNLRSLLALSLLLVAACANTASAAEYSLNQGVVHFSVPDNWNTLMSKTSGDPQLYAFQVPNPQAAGTLTRVTVSTHALTNDAAFAAFVITQSDKAANLPHYKKLSAYSPSASSMHYSAEQDGETLDYRESFHAKPQLAVQLRCVSPHNNPASSKWKRAYEHACAAIAKQLEH